MQLMTLETVDLFPHQKWENAHLEGRDPLVMTMVQRSYGTVRVRITNHTEATTRDIRRNQDRRTTRLKLS